MPFLIKGAGDEMVDEVSTIEWVIGGACVLGVLATGYLMNLLGKTNTDVESVNKDLAAHKTHVAEKYLTKDEFSETAKRLEGRIESGNRANLESNEKIRTEMNANQGTLINLIANIKGNNP